MFEAFKAGLIDYRIEDDVDPLALGIRLSRRARTGASITAAIPNGLPKGVSGFAFNTRRPMFADPRVREALASMFDFEWINANLYAGAYKRSEGFFDDSELSSIGRPASEREKALLAPFPGAVRADVMDGTVARARLRRLGPRPGDRPPRDRANWRARATALKDGRLVDRNGAPLAFEIVGEDPRGGAACARLRAQSRPHRRRPPTSASSTRCSSSAAARGSTST